MDKYFDRVADKILAEELSGMGAVLVQGPKWCGKTTTCEQLAKSLIYLNDPRKSSHYQQIAEIDVIELMHGEQPRLMSGRIFRSFGMRFVLM